MPSLPDGNRSFKSWPVPAQTSIPAGKVRPVREVAYPLLLGRKISSVPDSLHCNSYAPIFSGLSTIQIWIAAFGRCKSLLCKVQITT